MLRTPVALLHTLQLRGLAASTSSAIMQSLASNVPVSKDSTQQWQWQRQRQRGFSSARGEAAPGLQAPALSTQDSGQKRKAPPAEEGAEAEAGRSSAATAVSVSVNLPGLKAEVLRVSQRAFKKATKASQRLLQAQQGGEAENNADTVLELQTALEEQQQHLRELEELQEELRAVHKQTHPLLPDLLQLAARLGVSDSAPPRPERPPKKAKPSASASPSPRLPYREYTSADGVAIRVGRGAEDNELLSCDRRYRDAQDWWLHVSGSPGSHVVIRSHRDDLPSALPEVRLARLLSLVSCLLSLVCLGWDGMVISFLCAYALCVGFVWRI